MNAKIDINPIASTIWAMFQIVLIILKAMGIITCSLWIVLLPLWIFLAMLVIMIVVLIILKEVYKKYF